MPLRQRRYAGLAFRPTRLRLLSLILALAHTSWGLGCLVGASAPPWLARTMATLPLTQRQWGWLFLGAAACGYGVARYRPATSGTVVALLMFPQLFLALLAAGAWLHAVLAGAEGVTAHYLPLSVLVAVVHVARLWYGGRRWQ